MAAPAPLVLGPLADLLSLQMSDAGRYPVLLESSGGDPALARYDILLAFPGATLRLDADGQLHTPDGRQQQGDFLDSFNDWWQSLAVAASPRSDTPFSGGWFLFLAYEMAQQVEPALHLATDRRTPLALAVRIPAAVIRDRDTGRCVAIAEAGSEELLGKITADFRRCQARSPPKSRFRSLVRAGSLQEEDPEDFLQAVPRVKRHIAAGNVYQANISRRWQARLNPGVQPWMIYERLRRTNPAPFAGLVLLDECTILSSSPERLVHMAGGRVTTRPIAGTRPRRGPAGSEPLHQAELLANPKERAEHVMLIDLERNDLGRICVPGTVQVDELMVVESYAHVHHIVSGISGKLRSGVRPGDVLRAVFPGGTITGCPKVRCMGVIREIERTPRGAYTGTMGYINRDGSGDFNILIRSMTIHGDRLDLSTGSGIVWDSDAWRELEETRAKATGMLLALDGGQP